MPTVRVDLTTPEGRRDYLGDRHERADLLIASDEASDYRDGLMLSAVLFLAQQVMRLADVAERETTRCVPAGPVTGYDPRD